MESLIEFFTFKDPNIKYVVFGAMLLASSSAIVGAFTFLRKRALVGDAVAHSVLPGVCIGFLVAGDKDPLLITLGAFISGWLSLVIIDFIVSRSKIKEDTAIGLMLSVFFGLGILLLTMIQRSGNAAQSGLNYFLFGQAASLIGSDVWVFGIIALILIIAVILLFKEFMLISFDKQFAQTIGLPVNKLELVLTSLTVLAVVIGIQAVGVVLMAAMLITPAAAGRFWSNNLRTIIILAALFGAFSGISGAYVSYIAPNMPTGPWIVMVISFIAFGSFFFAPNKGILFRVMRQRKNRKLIHEENVLKTLYKLGEGRQNFNLSWSPDQISRERFFPAKILKSTLKKLAGYGYVQKTNDNQWVLTTKGKSRGQRILKIHRLWEVYLSDYMNIASDHVHEDAETMEHIITPELEKQLEQNLNYPEVDPHASEIPYNKENK